MWTSGSQVASVSWKGEAEVGGAPPLAGGT
jgi:hypothetical protein